MTKTDDGTVEIHGKIYKTVAKRLTEFWLNYPTYRIATEVLEWGEVVRVKATITDEAGNVVATGHAEEIRGATNILKTSAVETCETSAIGRCLGVYGLGGTQIASAEEVALALEQQDEADPRLMEHNKAVRDWFEHVVSIKIHLRDNEYSSAYESFAEIDPEVVKALWIAPTKGGIFTTEERSKLKSNEWNDARKTHHNIMDEE